MMRRRLGLALALLGALAMLPAAGIGQPRSAPKARDWSTTIVATAEGGFRMGNPGARVKIVEYLSLTCPHCAAFAHEGAPRLIADYVRTGRASLEYRHFVLNGADVAATILARCGGPTHYFRIVEHLFATQPQWTARIGGATAAQREEMQRLAPAVRVQRIAALGGLPALAAQRGLSAQRAQACLADETALQRLGEMAQAAQAAGVQGTPTFAINGALVSVNDWASLEPLIRRAGG